MGTSGSVTVRWKNRYWVVRHHWDAYPSGLGFKILNSIPKDPHEYQKWMENLQKEVEDKVNEYLTDEEMVYYFDDQEIRTTEPAPFGCDYEIDLDHGVFLYLRKPLFSLKSMPPEREFEEIADDSDEYPHHLSRSRVPEQYKHNWEAAPPTVNPSDLETYHSLINPDAIIDDISRLLSIPEDMTPAEESRIATYESLIYVYLRDRDLNYFLSRIDTIASSEDIPLDIISLGISIIAHGLRPMIFDSSSSPLYAVNPSFLSLSEGYDWIVWGYCIVKVVTHLNNEVNQQAAVVEIVNLIQEEYNTNKIQIEAFQAVYGILFSFSHCVLVRAEFSSGIFAYTHSPPFKFFPVEYPVDGSTPGITAVARLGHILYRYFLDSQFSVPSIIKLEGRKKEPAVLRVPAEIWRIIADQLHYYVDLKMCASFSQASKEATIDSMSFPRVNGATFFTSVAQEKARTTNPRPKPSTGHKRTEWEMQETEDRNTFESIFDARTYGKGSTYKNFREGSRTPHPKEIKGRLRIDLGYRGDIVLYRPLKVPKCFHGSMRKSFKQVTNREVEAVTFRLEVVCGEGMGPMEIAYWATRPVWRFYQPYFIRYHRR
ncbi:hypothetical protein VKT23_011523 [Stygiomarasmius scandens]|uniref:Uncharacterized protein n=1 Tax=Marasmiellus scandens TaxID=2682957 RepID=A0ABR1J8I6_9AGAR